MGVGPSSPAAAPPPPAPAPAPAPGAVPVKTVPSRRNVENISTQGIMGGRRRKNRKNRNRTRRRR